MERRFSYLGGAVGLFGVWAWLRRKPRRASESDPTDDLRAKLEESRALVDERETFEERETPVDQADPEARRRTVHEQARARLEGLKDERGEDGAR